MNCCCVLFVRPCSGTCCLWSARVLVTFSPARVFGYFINHACKFLCRLLKEWCGFIYKNHAEDMFPFKKWNLFLAVLHLEVAGTENKFSWSWGWFLCSTKFFSSPSKQPRQPSWRGHGRNWVTLHGCHKLWAVLTKSRSKHMLGHFQLCRDGKKGFQWSRTLPKIDKIVWRKMWRNSGVNGSSTHSVSALRYWGDRVFFCF